MSNVKTEVIFCTDGIFPHAVGGMQRHSLLLAEKLAAFSDIALTVVHPHPGISVFNNPGIREIALTPAKSSGRYLVDCYNYSKQVYEIVKSNPNVVVYSQGLSVWYKIGQFSNRIIVNPHGLEAYQTISVKDYLKGIPFRLIFNHLFRNSKHVVSLGGRLTGILNRVAGKNRVVVLPNAVNVPPRTDRNYDASPLQFLFVGRFALNKGINILAEAVKELNDEGYAGRLSFNLVGKGPLFEEYRKKYNFGNLHFLGFADDNKLNELYRTNDVFVLPTLFEGMPTVVLEAMANGMPIIVTDVGATLEMVDSNNGFIIEKNDVQSLKTAILNYLNMSVEARRAMADYSFLKVSNQFTWNIVAQKHADLFRQINKGL